MATREFDDEKDKDLFATVPRKKKVGKDVDSNGLVLIKKFTRDGVEKSWLAPIGATGNDSNSKPVNSSVASPSPVSASRESSVTALLFKTPSNTVKVTNPILVKDDGFVSISHERLPQLEKSADFEPLLQTVLEEFVQVGPLKCADLEEAIAQKNYSNEDRCHYFAAAYDSLEKIVNSKKAVFRSPSYGPLFGSKWTIKNGVLHTTNPEGVINDTDLIPSRDYEIPAEIIANEKEIRRIAEARKKLRSKLPAAFNSKEAASAKGFSTVKAARKWRDEIYSPEMQRINYDQLLADNGRRSLRTKYVLTPFYERIGGKIDFKPHKRNAHTYESYYKKGWNSGTKWSLDNFATLEADISVDRYDTPSPGLGYRNPKIINYKKITNSIYSQTYKKEGAVGLVKLFRKRVRPDRVEELVDIWKKFYDRTYVEGSVNYRADAHQRIYQGMADHMQNIAREVLPILMGKGEVVVEATKGACGYCNQTIFREAAEFEGRLYHPSCLKKITNLAIANKRREEERSKNPTERFIDFLKSKKGKAGIGKMMTVSSKKTEKHRYYGLKEIKRLRSAENYFDALSNTERINEIHDKAWECQPIASEAKILAVLSNPYSNEDTLKEYVEWFIDKRGLSFVGMPSVLKKIDELIAEGRLPSSTVEYVKEEKLKHDIISGAISDPEELKIIPLETYHWYLTSNCHSPADLLFKIEETCLSLITESPEDLQNCMNELKRMTELDRAEADRNHSGIYSDFYSDLKRTLKGIYSNANYPLTALEKRSRVEGAKSGNNGILAVIKGKIAKEILTNRLEKIALLKKMEDKNEFEKWLKSDEHNYSWEVQEYYQTVKNYTTEEKVQLVKERLNLVGDDEELLALFHIHALQVEGDQPVRRYIKKINDPTILARFQGLLKKRTSNIDRGFDFKIMSVHVVDPPPHKQFLDAGVEMGNVHSCLFHGTTFGGGGGIIASGVKIDADGRTGQIFGNGFYLTDKIDKAVQYCGKAGADGEGILLVCDAALGKTIDKSFGFSGYERNKWHDKYDSLIAKGGKYLFENECVVKTAQQLRIRAIVHVKKVPKGKEKEVKK